MGTLRYCSIQFKRNSNELHFFKVASIWDDQVRELFIYEHQGVVLSQIFGFVLL